MHRVIQLLAKASPVGVSFVLVCVGLSLFDFFTHFENAIVRWLCSAFFVLYWPDFVCACFIFTDSELEKMDDRYHLLFTGGFGFLVVSAGCLYDHFVPQFAQHYIYGNIPDYAGLKWTMGASLLYGCITATRLIGRHRPKQHEPPEV